MSENPLTIDVAHGTAAIPKNISTRSMSPPDSAKTAAPPVGILVGTGVCRHSRRELDAAREVRIAAGQSFAPHPRHLVHFADCWLCTDCGHPIVHHFDCVRTLEQLDAAREKRIIEVSGLHAFDSVINTPASTPPSHSMMGSSRFDENSAFSRLDPRVSPSGRESPASGQTPDAVAVMPTFAPDPRYMAHVVDGSWVCSFPSCLQPIEVHRSDPATAAVHKKLQEPPLRSHLSVLAPFVGRVAAPSPRSPRSSSGIVGPYALTNNAFIARGKMGNYADVCCVCGYPAYQRYHRYPVWKVSKHGETLRPGVTMAHILAPDALEAVGYADDETNYLPLCGSLGWEGSCHDAFDKNLVLFAYEGGRRNDGRYVAWASDPAYRHLSGRHVVFANKPHRSALHARARHALTSSQVVETPALVSESIVRMWDTQHPDCTDDPASPASPFFDSEA
jgi:hypothetical protein